MSRNAGSNENDRFDEIVPTILTDLTKFVDLWKVSKSGDPDEISPRSLTKLYE